MSKRINRIVLVTSVLFTVAIGCGVRLGTRAGWQPCFLDGTELGFGLMELYGKGAVREVFRFGVVGMYH